MRLPRWLCWRSERELSEEIQAHIDFEVEENIARGLSPKDARAAAMRAFGNRTRVREIAREANPVNFFATFVRDVQYAVRLLTRSPLFSITIVLTLTLGIGLNSSVFTVLNAFLFRPLVAHDPASYAQVSANFSGTYSRQIHGSPRMLTLDEYHALRDRAVSFTNLAAYAGVRLTLAASELAEARGMLVSCNYLDSHGIKSRLGRTLIAEDCAKPGGQPVAVISEALWRTQFQSDESIVGRNIALNKHTFTIVGVIPEKLTGEPLTTGIFVPYTMQAQLRPPDDYFRNPAEHAWLSVDGRLKPGTTRREAQAELATIAAQLDAAYPGRTMSILVTDGARINDPGLQSRAPMVIGLIMGSLTLILLIVCANVTTLLLSRAAARRPEMAIRLSMGASRARLLRQLLTESLLLSAVAGAASWWLAYHMPGILLKLIPNAPEVPLDPDWRIFAYILAVAIIAGCVAGLSPALESLRLHLTESLKPQGRGGSGRTSSRIRSLLVGAQLAMSLALLTSGGLMFRAQRQMFSLDLGYDPEKVAMVRLDLTGAGYNAASARAFYETLLDRLKALPGVESSALSGVPPFRGVTGTRINPSNTGDPKDFQPVHFRHVSPGYFELMSVRILRGRAFTEAEAWRTGGAAPVVVSESFARRFWPGEEPVGKRFQLSGNATALVIGLAADTSSFRLPENDGPLFYQSFAQDFEGGTLLLRFSGAAPAVLNSLRSTVRELDSDMLVTPETIGSIIEELKQRYASVVTITSIPGVLALFLALMGIYGVAAFAAAQRTHEVGVRMAIGATRADIIRLLLRSLTWPLAGGVVFGVALAAVIGTLMINVRLLMDGRAVEPLTYSAAAILLVAAALLATFIPARRAANADPWISLRNE